VKVLICLPVYDTFKKEFVLSLAGLITHSLTKMDPRPEIQTAVASESRIATVREALALNALNQGADYLLWLDSDMEFPENALERLLAHDLPAVGCNAMQRRVPEPAAFNLVNGRSERVWTTKDKAAAKEVEAVSGLGLAIFLLRADVLRSLPRPWFQDGPFGEDGHFWELAARKGIRPHIDHALSMEVGHIAETVLRF
jgi:hypothetical protein